ncbi:hypothetical protein, partial [Shigella dysenteriae]
MFQLEYHIPRMLSTD